ncbi:MAG: hypothetical protein OCC45_04010 [Desulfotalea sp.]
MKIICPYCTFQGGAKDSRYNRKVKCPSCQKHFIIEVSVIKGAHNDISVIADETNKERTQDAHVLGHLCASCGQVLPNIAIADKSTLNPLADSSGNQRTCSSCTASVDKANSYCLGLGIYCENCVPKHKI